MRSREGAREHRASLGAYRVRSACEWHWNRAAPGAAIVQPTYDELAAARQPTLAIDETPTKEGAQKSWLWPYAAREFTLFAVRPSREATGVSDLLGDEFAGVVTCDRARMYLSLADVQWCWAHLTRDFQKLLDSGDSRAQRLGWDLGAQGRRLFQHWNDFRTGAISRCALVRRMGPVRRRIEQLLTRGAASGHKMFAGTCRELSNHRTRLRAFLKHEGVEPTNNASERPLRHAVIWRKLSFGTQIAAGSRFVESMLTVVESCRQQRRNVFDYLVQAVKAPLAGRNPSSLLPGRERLHAVALHSRDSRATPYFPAAAGTACALDSSLARSQPGRLVVIASASSFL